MPGFAKDGDFRIVSLITGPSHVRLGVLFGSTSAALPKLTQLPAIGTCDHGPLSEPHIQESVLEGVRQANDEFGTSLHPVEIQYVRNDSARYEMFTRCAYLLVKAVHDDIDFSECSDWGT